MHTNGKPRSAYAQTWHLWGVLEGGHIVSLGSIWTDEPTAHATAAGRLVSF